MSKTSADIIKKVMSECLGLTNEKIFLIGDHGKPQHTGSYVLTKSFEQVLKKEGFKTETCFQTVKSRGASADPVLVKKLLKLPKKSVIIIQVSNRLGRMDELNNSFRTYAKLKGHRFISASTLGSMHNDYLPTFFKSLDINYAQTMRRSEKLKKILDSGREVHISTKAGTDLTYNIEGIEAKRSDGVYKKPGTGGNLPGSEVYIAPNGKKVEGSIVIDGSVRLKNKSMLVRSPTGVRMQVEKGSISITNKTIEARSLEDTIRWAHKKSEFPWGVRRVCELGIGLNPHAKIIGTTILDEKTLGSAHIAIGSNQWFGGSIFSIIHLDQVMREAHIKVDGRKVQP